MLRVPGCFGTHKWNLAELLVNLDKADLDRGLYYDRQLRLD